MEDSISGIAVIKRFYALRDDHGLWDIGMELDLITPEQETIHYFNHTGIDKGSDDVVTEYFEKLKKKLDYLTVGEKQDNTGFY